MHRDRRRDLLHPIAALDERPPAGPFRRAVPPPSSPSGEWHRREIAGCAPRTASHSRRARPVAIAGDVGCHQWPRHRRRLEQRARQAFAIGRQHDGRGRRDMGPHIVGVAECSTSPGRSIDPSSTANPAPIAFVERAEQLEPPIRLFAPEQPRRLNEFSHALVAEQAADEKEPTWPPSGCARGRELIEIDAGARQHRPAQPDDPAATNRSRSSGFWKKTIGQPRKASR